MVQPPDSAQPPDDPPEQPFSPPTGSTVDVAGTGSPGEAPTEVPDNRSAVWRRSTASVPPPTSSTPDETAEPAGRGGAAGAVDGLREAYLAVAAAYDRATEQLHDATHPLPRLALASWDDAIGQAGAALAAVRSGLAEARTLPGVPPATVGGMIAGCGRRAVRRSGPPTCSRRCGDGSPSPWT